MSPLCINMSLKRIQHYSTLVHSVAGILYSHADKSIMILNNAITHKSLFSQEKTCTMHYINLGVGKHSEFVIT